MKFMTEPPAPSEALDAPAAPAAATRAPRNRAQTEAKLRTAVESLLIKGGFAALTPSAVAREAGVDKMLIYRYFNDLPGLVRSIAYAPDFFPTFEDWCGPDTAALRALPPAERAARLMERMASDLLLARPVVLELMVWELVERNDLTAIMEEAREALGLRIMTEMFPDIPDPDRMAAAAAVLTAGLTYLALRRRKIRWYNGVDLQSDAGWRRLADAMAVMVSGLFD
jgi:AcrR family transcriptional regulator